MTINIYDQLNIPLCQNIRILNNGNKSYLGNDKGGVGFLFALCCAEEGAGQDSFLYV